MALGFVQSEKQDINIQKFKTTEKYQQIYYKAGKVDVDQDPKLWQQILKGM